MTPTQQSALEALAGRPLTAEEITLADSRTDGLLAIALSIGRTRIAEYWLTDRGLAADIVTAVIRAGGDMASAIATSDSILSKLDTAAQSSRTIKALVNRLETDARGLDFGQSSLRAWFAASTPELFTADELGILLALPVQPDPITVDRVSDLLNAVEAA